ncbi:MAG: alpha/beta fold hydrolase, partial [Limisphaerales bacterium]
MLHGLFGSLDNWLGVAPRLAETFTLYLVDQRNHGLSPH